MHILFVDESGHTPPQNRAEKEPVFVLGGIIIPERVWPMMRDELSRLKRSYRVQGEIKWRYFTAPRPGSKLNPLSHLTAVEKESLRTDLLHTVSRHKAVRVIASVVDTVSAYAAGRITTPDEMYHDAYKQLSERFQYFLQDLEREAGVPVNGLIVCDNRNNDQDDRLKEFHQTLLRGGVNTSTYKNFVEGLFIAASHHSVGTQFADLVAGAVFRAEARNDQRFITQIRSSFRQSPTGKIDGYGLVRIPKQRA